MKASLQPKEDQINDGKRKVDELGGQLERQIKDMDMLQRQLQEASSRIHQLE